MTIQKLIGLAQSIFDREGEVKNLRTQAAQLEKQARLIEEGCKADRAAIATEVEQSGDKEVVVGTWSFALVPGPHAVELDGEVDEKALTWKGQPLPERYIRTKAELNRSLLSAELKAGQSVGFARLVQKPVLSIVRIDEPVD